MAKGTAQNGRAIIKNASRWKHRILIGIPSLGTVRFEWHNAFCSSVIPMNWSSATTVQPVPCIGVMNYHVAEAQNLIVKTVLEGNWEWLLLIEDDVVIPPNIFCEMMKWIEKEKWPVVSGLYHLKSEPPEPMTFRGRGNGVFNGWKMGDTVWCDGVPTGCLLISRKLLQVCWDASPEIALKRLGMDGASHEIITREVFVTKREAGINPETGGYYRKMGTSDLEWCDRILDHGLLKEAGFKEAARKKYPFPVDTSIACGHIDLSSGRIY